MRSLTVTPGVPSAAYETQGKGLAVVIGIDDYSGALPALRNAVRDARAVGDCLRVEHGYDLVSLCDADAGYEALRDLFATGLAALANRYGRLVVYFAGHGQGTEQSDGMIEGVVLPHGADAPGLPMADIRKHITALATPRVLIILDCCFAGAFGVRRDVTQRSPKLTQEHYAYLTSFRAAHLVVSAASREKARDATPNSNHSPFAAGLLAALRREPHRERTLIVSDLAGLLRKHMLALDIRDQTPLHYQLPGHEGGELVFFTRPNVRLPSAKKLTDERNPYVRLKTVYVGWPRHMSTLEAHPGGLIVVLGDSGIGKSTLLSVALVSRLKARRREIITVTSSSASALDGHEAALLTDRATIIVDSVEDFPQKSLDQLWRRLAAARSANSTIVIIAAARSGAPDRPSHLLCGMNAAEWALWNPTVIHLRRDELTRDDLRAAIEHPAEASTLFFSRKLGVGIHAEKQVLDVVLDELETSPSPLALMGIILGSMYRALLNRPGHGREIGWDEVEAPSIVECVLRARIVEVRENTNCNDTLTRIVCRFGCAPLLASSLDYGDPDENRRVHKVLDALVAKRLLVRSGDQLEVIHDSVRSMAQRAPWSTARWSALERLARETGLRGSVTAVWWARQLFFGPRFSITRAERAFLVWSVFRGVGLVLSLSILVIVGNTIRDHFHAAGAKSDTLLQLDELRHDVNIARTGHTYEGVRDALKALAQADVLRSAQVTQELLDLGRLASLIPTRRDLGVTPVAIAIRGVSTTSLVADNDGYILQPFAQRLANIGVDAPHTAISPSGELVVFAGGSDVRVWRVSTGAWIADAMRLPGRDMIGTIAFSADDSHIAVERGGQRVDIIDVKAWIARPVEIDGSGMIALDATGARLIAGASGTSWRVELVTIATDFRISLENSDGQTATAGAFSLDGLWLALGGPGGASVWELGNGVAREFPSRFRDVTALGFDASSARVAAAYGNGNVMVWPVRQDPNDGIHLYSDKPLLSLGFGDQVLGGLENGGGTLYLWDLASRLVLDLHHQDAITALTASSAPGILATGSIDGATRLWDLRTGERLVQTSRPQRITAIEEISPGRFAAAGADRRVVVIDGAGLVSDLGELHKGAILGLSYSRGFLATGSADGAVAVVDLTKSERPGISYAYGEEQKPGDFSTPDRPDRLVTNLAWSHSGNILATIKHDGRLGLWNRGEWQHPIAEVSCGDRSNALESVHWSQDDTHMLVIGSRATCLYDASHRGSTVVSEQDLAGTFSPDGGRIATASADGTARILDANDGHLIHTLNGHVGNVRDVAYAPAGCNKIATVGDDGTLRLWEASTGKELIVLLAHTGAAEHVLFLDAGARVATAGVDGFVHVFPTCAAPIVHVLCKSVGEASCASLPGDECCGQKH